jgi:hypothetical protein
MGKGRGSGGMKGSTQPCLSLPALYFLSKSKKHLTRAGLGPGPARAAANLSRAAFTLRKILGVGGGGVPLAPHPGRGGGGHFSTHSLPPFTHNPQPLTPPAVSVLFTLWQVGCMGFPTSSPSAAGRWPQWHFTTLALIPTTLSPPKPTLPLHQPPLPPTHQGSSPIHREVTQGKPLSTSSPLEPEPAHISPYRHSWIPNSTLFHALLTHWPDGSHQYTLAAHNAVKW